MVIAFPAALTCWIEERADQKREKVFSFWAECFALLPGTPGMHIRRAFYRYVLESCATNWHIGFGAIFTHRKATVETDVYVGAYALIGTAILRQNCLIGSRTSLLSGRYQHKLDAEGKWATADASNFVQIEIGEYAWIGEGAVVMNDIGRGAMVAAGGVVSTAVPDLTMVGGNPARFVQRLEVPSAGGTQPESPE